MAVRETGAVWREGATPEEADALRRLDADMNNMRALLATMARERQLIANRACQRAIYRRKNNHAQGNIPVDV